FARAQVADALAGDGFRVGRVVEHLHRYPARVAAGAQGPEDRHKVRGAEARAAPVGVVGVEVAEPAGVAADQVGGRRLFRGHRLDVEVQAEGRVVDAVEQLDGLGR